MGQGIKVLATKPDDLRSIPRTHAVEEENQPLPCKFSSDLYVHVEECTHPHTQINKV